MSFKRGDKVTAFGLDGYVVEVNTNHHQPVTVQFSNGEMDSFLPDGRYMEWHKLPSLFKLVIQEVKSTSEQDLTDLYNEGWGGYWGGE